MKVKGIVHFELWELVPREILERWGDKSLMFLDMRILKAADLFREIVGNPVTINDGRYYNESGLREFDTDTGASMSQHKFGRALDLKVKGMTSSEMAGVILDNKKEFMRVGLTTIEDPQYTRGRHQDWLHIDCRYTGLESIMIVTP